MRTNIRRASPCAPRRLWTISFTILILLLTATKDTNAQAVVCPPNIDFSFGNLNNWYCWTGNALAGSSVPPPVGPLVTPAWTAGVYSGPMPGRHTITSGLATDPYGGFSVTAPGGGLFSLKLGNDLFNDSAERVQYYVRVPVGFSNYSFAFKYAVVFEDPGHNPDQQPGFIIRAYDSATNIDIPCATLTYVAGVGLPGFMQSTSPLATTTTYYLPWTSGTLNLSGQGGKTIIVEATTYDCTQGGHFGYGYFDVISCGQFAATITYCNLSAGYVTLSAPAGYKTYKWFKGPTISGAPVSTAPSFNAPAPTTPTFYYCVLDPYNSNGCPDTIRTRTISNFTIDATPDTVCNTLGKPIQLNVTTAGGLGGFTFGWKPDPTLSTPYNVPNPIASPTGSGMYVVTVTDSIGCFRQDTVIIQNPAFKIKLGPDITTCLGTPVTLNPTLTPASPGYIFKWSPGTGLNNTTILKPTYTPYGTLGTFDEHLDTFILRVDSGVCAAADTIRIRTLPDHFETYDTAVCQLHVLNPRVEGSDSFKYVWAPSSMLVFNPGPGSNHRQAAFTADTTRTFQVTAKYPNCPDLVRNITVRVEPLPNVDLGFDTIQKCFYTPLYLTAHVQPAWFTKYSYLWNANDFIDVTSAPIITFTGPADTTLIVTVTTPLGCTGTDSVRVQVYQGSFGAVTPSDTAVCPRNSITMSATGGVSYLWKPSIYLSDSTSATVIANPVTSTDYTLFVTDKNGCVDTLPISLQVYSEVGVSLPDSAELYPGESYQLDPGGNALYFSWFPTVGLSSSGIANPVATPSVNTRYYVTGTTEPGCKAIDSIYIMVHEESVIDMANAFTPGLASNSDFSVSHLGLASLKSFRIYNRWGTKVFETTDINKGWNGDFGGKPQPLGVYIYVVEGVTNKGTIVHKQGNVTLLR